MIYHLNNDTFYQEKDEFINKICLFRDEEWFLIMENINF